MQIDGLGEHKDFFLKMYFGVVNENKNDFSMEFSNFRAVEQHSISIKTKLNFKNMINFDGRG